MERVFTSMITFWLFVSVSLPQHVLSQLHRGIDLYRVLRQHGDLPAYGELLAHLGRLGGPIIAAACTKKASQELWERKYVGIPYFQHGSGGPACYCGSGGKAADLAV